MFTKLEEYYCIVCKRSPNSFRNNNYDTIPLEFKTKEAAEKLLNHILNTSDSGWEAERKGYSEFTIVKFTNEPILNVKNTNYIDKRKAAN